LLNQTASNFGPEDEQSTSAIRKQLTQAGFYQPSALAYYYILRLMLAVLLPEVFCFANHYVALEFTGTRLLVNQGLLTVLWLYGPRIFLFRITTVLQRQCRECFPDFMDLMVVCAEAGLLYIKSDDRSLGLQSFRCQLKATWTDRRKKELRLCFILELQLIEMRRLDLQAAGLKFADPYVAE